MNKEEFVINAIQTLRNPERSQGIHSVFSGFNSAFKEFFGEDSRPTTDKMVAAGELVIRPVKGGVMMYSPDEAPTMEDAGANALKKMGLK